MRYLIKFDTPIQLLHACADGQDWEMEGYEGVPLRWTKTAEQTVDGQKRMYYASCPPYRVLVVSQNGVDIRRFQRLPTATGPAYVYATALVGWDKGTKGYVHAGQEGRQHTKISIQTMFTFGNADQPRVSAEEAGIEIVNWSDLLRGAPRADRAGGYRGSQGRNPISADEETVSIRASVPASYAEILKGLGDGNVSLGLRRVIESVQPGSDQAITVASRHAATEQMQPKTIKFTDGRYRLHIGNGVLADVFAASVEAGIIAGDIVRGPVNDIYYWRAGGYDDLTLMVM